MTITTVIRSDLFRHTDFTSLEAATIAEHIMACKDMGYISESEIPKLAEKMAETHALVPYEPEPLVAVETTEDREAKKVDFITKSLACLPINIMGDATATIAVENLGNLFDSMFPLTEIEEMPEVVA